MHSYFMGGDQLEILPGDTYNFSSFTPQKCDAVVPWISAPFAQPKGVHVVAARVGVTGVVDGKVPIELFNTPGITRTPTMIRPTRGGKASSIEPGVEVSLHVRNETAYKAWVGVIWEFVFFDELDDDGARCEVFFGETHADRMLASTERARALFHEAAKKSRH